MAVRGSRFSDQVIRIVLTAEGARLLKLRGLALHTSARWRLLTGARKAIDMNAVIFGITGYAGSAIAGELLSRGHRVTGVARNISGAPVGIETREGSLHDADFVRSVVEGADAVVLAVRATSVAQDGPELPAAVETMLPRIMMEGARLGVVGGAGTLRVAGGARVMDSVDFLPAWRPEAEAQQKTLSVLLAADKDLDWFYVSPSAVFGSHAPGERTGKYRTGTDDLLVDADGSSHISGADYALAFVDELENPRHRRQRFTVGY